MHTNTRLLRSYILFVGDVVMLYLSLVITLILRYQELELTVLKNHLISFTPFFAMLLTVFYASRLYDLTAPQTITALLQQTFSPLLISLAISIGYFYFFSAKIPGFISPKTNLALFFVIFTTFFILWRRFSHKIFTKTLVIKSVIVAPKNEIEKLTKILYDHPEYGYQIVFAATENEWNKEILYKLINENGVSSIIAAPNSIKLFAPYLAELVKIGIDFWDLISFYEARLERIPLSLIEETWLLERIVWKEPKVFTITKTIIDRIIATLMLILTLPIWPIIVLLIKLTSEGPVFYLQKRIGYDGKEFILFKFRTMRQDAEIYGAVWAKENDPRLTPIGRILRKLHLDELPQLLNILKGEMSFVGPRPERPEFVEQLRKVIPFYDLRHLVKPGLTGWAQLNFRYGASIEDARQKLEYDLYYIKNRSIALDLAIILKTLNIILRGGTGR